MDRLEKIAYDRKYRERNREALRAYEFGRRSIPERSRDPLKLSARYALRSAVREGRITKPRECQCCGCAALLDGHHGDYSKPLEVE